MELQLIVRVVDDQGNLLPGGGGQLNHNQTKRRSDKNTLIDMDEVTDAFRRNHQRLMS